MAALVEEAEEQAEEPREDGEAPPCSPPSSPSPTKFLFIVGSVGARGGRQKSMGGSGVHEPLPWPRCA